MPYSSATNLPKSTVSSTWMCWNAEWWSYSTLGGEVCAGVTLVMARVVMGVT